MIDGGLALSKGTITYSTMMIIVCSCILGWFQGCHMQCPVAVG